MTKLYVIGFFKTQTTKYQVLEHEQLMCKDKPHHCFLPITISTNEMVKLIARKHTDDRTEQQRPLHTTIPIIPRSHIRTLSFCLLCSFDWFACSFTFFNITEHKVKYVKNVFFFYKDYSFSFLYINKTRVEMLFSQQGSAVSTRATFKTGQNPDDEGFYWQNSKLTRFPTFKCQRIIIIIC